MLLKILLVAIPLILVASAGYAFIRAGYEYFDMLDEDLEKEFNKFDKEFEKL